MAANGASFRLMDKLGMQREGWLRERPRLGGEWVDELVYLVFGRQGSAQMRG